VVAMSTTLLTRKYANAGHSTRLVAQMLASAPDGLLRYEIEEALSSSAAPSYIHKISRWGLKFSNEWLISCNLVDGHRQRQRLYRLAPESIDRLNQTILKINAVGL